MTSDTLYEDLLKDAPVHTTKEFLLYITHLNTIVAENKKWLVIQNIKYHTTEKPYYTAFFKKEIPTFKEIMQLHEMFLTFDLLIKPPIHRTIKRYHVHLIKKI